MCVIGMLEIWLCRNIICIICMHIKFIYVFSREETERKHVGPMENNSDLMVSKVLGFDNQQYDITNLLGFAIQ